MSLRKIITILFLIFSCYLLLSCSSINNKENENTYKPIVEQQENIISPLGKVEEVSTDELIIADDIPEVDENVNLQQSDNNLIDKDALKVIEPNSQIKEVPIVNFINSNELNDNKDNVLIQAIIPEKEISNSNKQARDILIENSIKEKDKPNFDKTNSIQETPKIPEQTINNNENVEKTEILANSLDSEEIVQKTDDVIIEERKYMNYLFYLSLILIVILLYRIRKTKFNLVNERRKNERLKISTIEESMDIIHDLDEKQKRLSEIIAQKDYNLTVLKSSNSNYEEQNRKLDVQITNKKKKISRINEIYKSIDYSIKAYENSYDLNSQIIENIAQEKLYEINLFSPTVIINLKNMNYKELRIEFNRYNKLVDELLEKYKSRYTTKTNKTIYRLMTIALRSELQNILYNLKFEKLDKAIDQVKIITSKYLVIATEGNKTIEQTLIRFVGELEYLFICLVKVEYEYYIKREQAKQEQLAIRQQMREEAEEKRILAEEAKKIKEEEAKYLLEISKLQEIQEQETDENKIKEIQAKMSELYSSLDSIKDKEDEILKLQNGKAGNVYVISNLGSFGDNTFKIGMTRRLDPQERINELGSASVPFKFDVHSFIFSDDAVSLENELHKRLNENRVNKVNMRKEFFNITIDDLEDLVLEINPTAEFNKTMIAEEYRQTLSQNVS